MWGFCNQFNLWQALCEGSVISLLYGCPQGISACFLCLLWVAYVFGDAGWVSRLLQCRTPSERGWEARPLLKVCEYNKFNRHKTNYKSILKKLVFSFIRLAHFYIWNDSYDVKISDCYILQQVQLVPTNIQSFLLQFALMLTVKCPYTHMIKLKILLAV